jgi:hypothetical protein
MFKINTLDFFDAMPNGWLGVSAGSGEKAESYDYKTGSELEFA